MKYSQKITAKEWRLGHPESLGFLSSDLYYARACTSLLSEINTTFNECELPCEGTADFALKLGHYIEDIVSGTHVFDSFRRIHQKKYGRKLPFYTLSADYADDEVNIEDVKFLIWDHVQQIKMNKAVINPDNVGIQYIAERLFPIVCDIYEEAPEVPELHDFIYNPDNFTDCVDCKKVLLWLMIDSPLTAPEGIMEDIEEEMDIIYDKTSGNMPFTQAFYFVASTHLFFTPCRWMALYAHEMLAQMLETEGMKLEAKKIGSLRHTGLKNFTLTRNDIATITVSDPDNANTYIITKDSFAESIETDPKYISTDLISFDGQTWEINGSCWFSKTAPKKKDTITDGPIAYAHHLKSLGGKLVGYFANLQEMQKKLADGINGTISDEIRSDLEDAPAIMVFLNSNGSLNVSPSLAVTIPDPANPYFRGIDHGLLLASALSESVASAEMARYFHEQGWYRGIGLSSTISPERGLELFEDNFDFFLRYFRGAEYHTI